MRSLAAVAAIAAVFGVVVFGAGSAAGIWGGPTGQASNMPGDVNGAKARKAAKKNQNARERLTARDMAIARAAVVRESNLKPPWREVASQDRGNHGCSGSKLNFARFTVTGKAQSEFKTPGGGLIESKVKIFTNAGQADEYFRLTSGQTVLDCMREGVGSALRNAGLSPKLLSAKLLTTPPFGEQTAIYIFDYSIQGTDGNRYEYPVDVVTFRMGRAIAAVSFSFVGAKRDEVGLARLVANRLSLSAHG